MPYKLFSKVILFLFLFGAQAQGQRIGRKEKKEIKYVQSAVKYLSSDRLAGRATGSDGEQLAVDFIKKEFQNIGLEAFGADGYFQSFEIITLRIASNECSMSTDSNKYELFTGFFPLSYGTDSAQIAGQLVNIHYGIPFSKSYPRGYQAKDVKGKICLVNLASPDGIHPHSKYLNWHGIQNRVDELQKSGALGVLFHTFGEQMEKPRGYLKKTKQTSSLPVIFVQDAEILHDTMQKIELSVKNIIQNAFGHNVIGYQDNQSENTIVIGAHHDHLGYGEISGAYPANSGKIHNGADDNASGVAGLLLLAYKLKKNRKSKKNNYLFITFSGEEMGLLGSKYYVENPTINLTKTNYMFNFDMIGRLKKEPSILAVNGVGTSSMFDFWKDSILNQKLGFDQLKVTKSGIGASDHSSFYLKNIPSLHFFTGQHRDYHKPEDDFEKLNYLGIVKVINYAEAWIESLNRKGKLDFQKTKNEKSARTRFSVTMGIMPDYVFAGEGLRIDGITDGKPANKAGIKAGDILINFDGKMIHDIQDYMRILSSLKKGQKVDAVIKRGKETKEVNIQF